MRESAAGKFMLYPGRRIPIGRHDNNFKFIDNCSIENERVRIGSTNPNSLTWVDYNVISTNGDTVLYNSRYYDPVEFFDFVKVNCIKDIMVLTRRERDFLLGRAVDFGVTINVFEEAFPLFEEIRYVSRLDDNVNEARKLLNECKNLGLNGGSAHKFVSTFFRYKQERKIRYKSKLDDSLYFSCLPPFQEVFKAKESRPDRLIFVLDFNAMFTDCMSGKFPSPKNLKYSKFEKEDYYKKKIYDGFYRVNLIDAKNSFFLNFHPFRYAESNRSYSFNLTEGDSIETFLPKDEIDCYSKYFSKVEIVEGIYSEKQIEHPLLRVSESIYRERKRFSSSHPRSKLEKLKANIISSLGNPKRYQEFWLKSKSEVISKIEDKLCIDFDDDLSQEQKLDIARFGNRVKIYEKSCDQIRVRIFNNESSDSVYALYSKIISNSRVKMIGLIEKLLSIESLDICYANVDSLHVSIEKEDRGELYSLLAPIMSNDIGGLKIEAVSKSAYWLDLGRYWLINGSDIAKFSNIVFNTGHEKKCVVTEKLIKKVISLNGFRYVKRFRLNLHKTFSFKKMIDDIVEVDNVYYRRYDLSDVINASVASSTMEKEKIRSYFFRSSLLDELATVECSSNITHNL